MRRTFCFALSVVLLAAVLSAPAGAEANEAIRFRDKVFEEKVLEILGAKEGPVTAAQAQELRELHLETDGGAPDSRKVHDISDVAHFPNLINFSAHGNAVSDLSPLKKLAALQYLDLGGNPVKNLKPLAKLTKLREVTIWGCGVKDLSPLKDCSDLTALDAKGNAVKDVSALKNLTRLKSLDLSDNKIKDAAPLAGLTGLETLKLAGNPVKDWSALAALYPNLAESDFSPDQMSAATLIDFDDAALEKKVRAAIGKKKGRITYGDVSGLRELYASFGGGKKEKKIQSIQALKYFTSLFKFEAFGQEIRDLTPLAGLKDLGILALDDCPVADLTPLSGLENLLILQIGGTGVLKDLTPVANLPRLGTIKAQGNAITDISPLRTLENLDTLDLSHNAVTDLTPLSGLKKLTSLRLAGNPVSDFTPIRDLMANLSDKDFEPLFADDVPDTPIEIADPAFEAALRRALGVTGRPITRRDAYLVRSLGVYNEKTEQSAFQDISPLKWFVNLEELEFNANPVKDLGALAGLTKLRSLNAGFLQVSDITPLAGLTNLESLSLRACPVTDVTPLSGLTKLRWLDLADCPVTDLTPLSGLKELELVR